MAYRIQWIGSDVMIDYYDVVHFSDIKNINDELYSDERFDTMKFQCVNLLNVTSHNISSDDMLIISALESSAASWKKKLKIAHVAVNPVAIEFINNFTKKLQLSSWKIRTFANAEEALSWCKS